MKLKINTKTKSNSYSVIIDKNLSENICKYLSKIKSGKKLILVYSYRIKENAQILYNNICAEFQDAHMLEIKDGENAKDIDYIKKIISDLVTLDCKRDSILLAIGGGTIGDIVGYVASIYMRGIRYINIPTTLLSMVDSSLGGKTAVNFGDIKNLVGTFHQPSAVFINPSYLRTLKENEIRSGMGEIIKYSLIGNKELLNIIRGNYNCIIHLTNLVLIEEIIFKCCAIKKHYIEIDEYDIGERNTLNFGHTLGHIIEKKYQNEGITHGEAILNGIFLAVELSFLKNILKKVDYNKINNYLHQLNVGYNYKLYEDDLKKINFDKKAMNNKIKFILLKGIGKPVICDDISKTDLLKII